MSSPSAEQDCFDSPESSNIASVCYIHHQSKLVITFKRGGSYEYTNVPPDTYYQLKQLHESGQSVGKYVEGVVKPTFTAQKVSNDQ